MKTYIALLRGINVGGHKKVPMAELRELLEKSGLENVKTYIQSGNVIFQSLTKDSKTLEKTIQKSIINHFGFEVPVLVKTRTELDLIFKHCPFPEAQKVESYFIVLSQKPNKDLVDDIAQKVYPNEEFVITNECVYIYYVLGAGKAKLGVNWFENRLKVKATARNFRTMAKLLEMTTS
ncbi:DUF1697 domain-containing protein [Winogradskyella forsetii]|uniref:DUF1697 domain-containing protein n=1 Tax=Winogradskyella forsetii TaxID=2686077 RepID=UPI0015BCBB9D|nr:DUF1697 domain-containing protein [Winogradskyella forsetii]